MHSYKTLKMGLVVIIGSFLLVGWMVSMSYADPGTPEATASEANAELPNLAITVVLYELETGGGCLYDGGQGYYGVSVWVSNTGKGNADPFYVQVNSTGQKVTQGLKAGSYVRLWFPTGADAHVRVDADNRVAESNEADNTYNEQLPMPTLPAVCNVTPTPMTISADTDTILTQAIARIWEPTPGVKPACAVQGDILRCELAAGHETTVSFRSIETPIDSADKRYRSFHDSPMLIWEEVSHVVATGTDRNIIWQIGGREIHIQSFDDTSFKIAFDPLLVAEAIYQAILETSG
jgi:hypothetical protein